jgi:hypothetical protein
MTDTQSWNDIPTCKEEGLDAQYLMLRAMFLPGSLFVICLPYQHRYQRQGRVLASTLMGLACAPTDCYQSRIVLGGATTGLSKAVGQKM